MMEAIMEKKIASDAKKNIDDLVTMLVISNIPFELRAVITVDEPSIQICSPSIENCLIDAVSHKFSYGGNEGFIEIMSEFEPDVVGWLDAKAAFKYFNRIKEAITK